MIMKPVEMKISESCGRQILRDRFYAKQRFIKDRPCLVSRKTPDIALWIRKGWIVPVVEEATPKKKIIKKKKV